MDFYVRSCVPNYGVISDDTEITILNNKIDDLLSVTIIVLHNELNNEFNLRKNQKLIQDNFIEPYFYRGTRRFVQRGDVIKLNDVEIFILKAKPTRGFIAENKTKLKLRFNYTLNECHFELNNLLERENQRDNNNINNINNENFRNNLSNPQLRNTNFRRLFRHNGSNFETMIERLHFINTILNVSTNDHFIRRFNRFNPNFLHQQKVESVIRALPNFKIDQKFLDSVNKDVNEENPKKKCIICMENYKIEDIVETLPCFHFFHKDCIEEWFKGNNDCCPICKHDLAKDNLNEQREEEI